MNVFKRRKLIKLKIQSPKEVRYSSELNSTAPGTVRLYSTVLYVIKNSKKKVENGRQQQHSHNLIYIFFCHATQAY